MLDDRKSNKQSRQNKKNTKKFNRDEQKYSRNYPDEKEIEHQTE